jgi:site-specific DNA recombinase
MQQLLRDAEAGEIDRVVVHRLDRISRRVIDFVAFLERLRDCGVALSIATIPELGDSAQDNFLLNILASMAEFEQDMIRSRMAESRAALKSRGRRVAGVVPYGYAADRQTKQLVPVPREARRVRKMFQLAAQNQTPHAIAAAANRRRWRKSAGNHWTGRQVLATLKNPVYVGRIRDGNRVRPGIHPPIVDESLFAQVSAAIEARRTGARKQSPVSVRRFLQGRVYCGRCGRLMSPVCSYYRVFRYDYYRCRSHKDGRPTCRDVSVPAYAIETFVREQLMDLDTWAEFGTLSDEQRARAQACVSAWLLLDDIRQRQVLAPLIERVVFDVDKNEVRIELNVAAVVALQPPTD